jgi:AAA15 family ATPase/GTPase
MFKSPFFHKESDILLSYSKNYEKKLMPLIIEFLKKVDDQINDIGLVEQEGIKRFLVDSSRYADRKVDITSYGEGVQRIFEISLAFAYAKNGVILIDELETGIHHSLLIDFTRFIQELSERFNVQVFITSHSKECLNAFVQNGITNEPISAYILHNNGEKVTYHHSEGEKFARLVETMDIDMRGEK